MNEKADKLFKALGWKKHEYKKEIVYSTRASDEKSVFYQEIIFSKVTRKIYIPNDLDCYICIDMRLLQTINLKCEELGWLNE